MPSPTKGSPVCRAHMAKEHVHAEEASHICTTLFTDLTNLSELEKLIQV